MLDAGLGSWIHRRRLKSGSDVALVHNGSSLTYAEFAERTDRLADALTELGVEPGQRVAYLGDNHPSFLETMFAVTALGAVFVPLNTRLAVPEVAFALDDSGADVLIHSAVLGEVARLASAGGRVRRAIEIGVAYDELLASGRPIHRDRPVTLDDPAVIMYTSGTTGTPKGAVMTHGNLTWNCLNVIVDYDFVSTDVALAISPLFHVASLGMGVLPMLLKGGRVILEAKFDAGRALALIEEHRATVISGVPTTYQMIAEHPAWSTTDISSLEKLTCGGSPVPLRVIDAYEARGLAFTGGYGMTETSPGATSLQPARSRGKAGSAGMPHFFSDVRIAGADGRMLPAGEVGEIQLSGPNVIAGYWNRPDATADAFASGGWLRSGDLGYLDDDGFLFVSDRLKDMIISGGENIYPAEVEQVIVELDAVGSVAVIGIPDAKWGEVPLAIIAVREGFTLTEDDIGRHLAGRVARYKIPKRVLFVDDLPRTASGKIRKADLRRIHSA